MKKRVAILGAGASGLVAIKSCLDEGLTPVCLEKTNDIGGLWNYTEKSYEGLACVMKTTVINTSKEMMCYSDYPIPAEYPNFMHNTKVYEYFKDYAKHFRLLDHIKFEHDVISVERADDFSKTGEWIVNYRDASRKGSDSISERFQAVMICTGHHSNKRIPDFPGAESFQGKIVHTHDYKDHRGFEDKRVVVVGIGNSGGDVAVELSRLAKQVYLSTRRGSWVLNRVSENGMPADILFTRRITEVVRSLVGHKLTNNEMRRRMNDRFDHKMYGLEPNYDPLAQHPMVNDELPNRIICGSIQLKPNIRRITQTGVIFEDGTMVDADVIIYATGYVFGFPYLEKGVIDVKDNVVNLYKYAFPPDLNPSTLAVIGCVQPWGAIMPIAELQCRWACSVFQGSTKLPSKQEMWQDIEKKQSDMRQRYVVSPRHTIQVDWIPFMDDVAQEFGAKPNVLKLLLTDPALGLQVLFGPCTPYQYRLTGPGAWSGARDAIVTQWDRVYTPFKTRPAEKSRAGGLLWKLIIMLVICLVIYKFFF